MSTSELQRLAGDAEPGATPSAGLVELAATCPGGAQAVLDKVREVLAPLMDPPDPWPAPDGWREILPAWFTEACSDDERVTSCVLDRWSLRAWVWWFQPEHRRWHWWDATADGTHLKIRLEPTGVGSLLLGSIEWLLKVAGASEVTS